MKIEELLVIAGLAYLIWRFSGPNTVTAAATGDQQTTGRWMVAGQDVSRGWRTPL